MKQIKHQLQKKEYYTPTWGINYLFVGTFNPEGGELVNYYYGRPKNQFWKLLSIIFNDDFNPNSPDFFKKIKKHKIGCIDMIAEIEAPENKVASITGEGYSDSKIINTCVTRTYNTSEILKIIASNPNIKIFSTWGKGPKLKEWRNEIQKTENIIPLVSPSMAAKVASGVKKFDYMLKNWTNKIK